MNRVTLDSRRGLSILVAVAVVVAAGALLAGSAAAATGDGVDADVTVSEESPDDICAGECQWLPDAGDDVPDVGTDVAADSTDAEQAATTPAEDNICQGGPPCPQPGDMVERMLPDIEINEPQGLDSTGGSQASGQASPNDICQGGPPCPGYYVQQWIDRLVPDE